MKIPMGFFNSAFNRAKITNNRIEALDALRGFALLGITLRHFLTRYNYANGFHSSNVGTNKLDRLIETADYHLFFGTVYPIFALLFGFSLFLYGRKSLQAGLNLNSILRLFSLLCFAVLDAAFFPSGDILGLYALVGILVLCMVKLPAKWMLWIAVFFLLQPFEWARLLFHGIDNLINQIHTTEIQLKADILAINTHGSLWQNIWANATKGELSSLLWAAETGRVTQTIGLMLLGFYLGKTRLFVRIVNEGKKLLNYIYIPMLVYIILFLIRSVINNAGDMRGTQTELILFNWMHLCLAAFYVIIFLAGYKNFFLKVIPSLKYYGRMSLTNYVSQSIIGGYLFAPFGFNFSGTFSAWMIVLLFLIVVTIQINFSKIWLTRHMYGPLEFYWRKFSVKECKKRSIISNRQRHVVL